VGQGGLAQPRRAVEQDVVERLAPAARRIDGDAQVVLQLLLADELGQAARAERRVQGLVVVLDMPRGDALRRRKLPPI
jgi:hypothetical protein